MEIREALLPHGSGVYVRARDLILVREGLGSAARLSTIHHEMAHRDLGHRSDDADHEARADRLAAMRLIPFSDLVAAVAWTPYYHEVAEVLGVEERLLRIRYELLPIPDRLHIDRLMAGHAGRVLADELDALAVTDDLPQTDWLTIAAVLVAPILMAVLVVFG